MTAARPVKQKPHEIAFVASAMEHDRRYVESLPDGRFEAVDSAHLMQAEQPQVIAASVEELLVRAEAIEDDAPPSRRPDVPASAG